VSSGGFIVGALVAAAGAFVALEIVDRDTVRPIARQLWIEEGPAQRPRNAQAIAEVLVRRVDRASKIKGRRVTVAQLQSGDVLDAYAGPISSGWAGYGDAIDAAEIMRTTDQDFRRRAEGAAWRALLAVRFGVGEQVAPGALWWRHAAPGKLPSTWRGNVLIADLDAPGGKRLGLYAPPVAPAKSNGGK
jgi:hypothetical protein